MTNKWECPFEKIREYPDCFQDCPNVGECKMKDCACLDTDARRCFELRYQGTTPENEMLMSTEVCGCTCHEKGMDFDGDECDCQGCNDRRIV